MIDPVSDYIENEYNFGFTIKTQEFNTGLELRITDFRIKKGVTLDKDHI